MKKWICLILACLALLRIAGCSDSAQETQNTNAEGFSLTNSILGEDYLFTYPEVPQRIVSLASPATEMLLALGLEESIVGYAMQDNEIPAQYKDAFDALHCITKDWTVSKEMILALEPDFLMFWNGSADYDYEFLNTNGISTYTMTSDVNGAKIESVYDDFTNMGKIFGKEDRAAEIIAAMKAKIDPVASQTKKLTPVSVAYVDAYSTEEAVFTAGDALVADIFRTAGAKNVTNRTNDPWMNISWEEMAAADPEWIVIGAYEGVEDADYWIEFLEKHPAMKETRAVQEDRYIVVGLADLTVGVDVPKLKILMIVLSALVTGIMVSVSGTIGFVGLIVPHIARTLVGPVHRRLIPFAALLGGIFMIWADTIARVTVAPSELPIGVVTAFIGAPFFLILLRRSRYSFQ